jgi:hypothetical protein
VCGSSAICHWRELIISRILVHNWWPAVPGVFTLMDTKSYFKYGKLVLMFFMSCLENRLLLSDLVIVKNHGDDEEDV